MLNYSASRRLIKHTKDFLSIEYYSVFHRLLPKKGLFYGWGRKLSGVKAIELAKKHNTSFVLLEDGFIRSVGLGVDGSPSFSLVEDDVGIYYDATTSSKLENILNGYDFTADEKLMATAFKAIKLIRKNNISKYNDATNEMGEILNQVQDDIEVVQDDANTSFRATTRNLKRVLIIAQTAGDASLEYGMLHPHTTDDMINAAIDENPNSKIYIKIHPDVLSGKKKSDIDISNIKKKCIVINENINPISLLKYFDKVYTKTSQMGFEALLLGKKCVCFGMPFYAGWGITDDRTVCQRRKRKLSVEEVFAGAYILYSRYFNPYTKKSSDVIDTIKTIARYRDIEFANSGRLFFFGFSRWKRGFMKPFFKSKNSEIVFCNTLADAIALGFDKGDKAFIWGMKYDFDIVKYCEEKNIHISRAEDGFIRSVSLGSDLTRPYSLVVDSRGIYIDPSKESDLEQILSTFAFDDALRQRAKKLIDKIVSSKFSKYNGFVHKKLSISAKPGQKVILVPAQVEDDASMIYGGMGMDTLGLIKEVREKNPSAYILYKPHPDVLSGNRKGLKDRQTILAYCDDIIENASIDSCIDICDEVHTITSTAGFDALIRTKEVFVYGMPFYAGWGVTEDKHKNERRTRALNIYELAAGALILYPRYVSPKTKKLCEVEAAFDEMLEMQQRYFDVLWFRVLMDSKTFVLRKVRRIIELILQLLGKR